jgi:predicted ATP-grasp superfamily ATP-dependent carboligase
MRLDIAGSPELPTLDRQLPQAIVLDPCDNGPPLAHSLRRHGVAVSLIATPFNAWTTRARGVDGHVLGLLPEETKEWLAALHRLAGRCGGVLIPASDEASQFVVLNREQIAPSLISFESEQSAHLALMNKSSLHDLATRAGVPQPRVMSVRSLSELGDAAAEIKLPCVLKPAMSHVWRRRFGERRVIVVQDANALAASAAPALDAGLELLVSEYVPGPVRNIETAVILRCGDGTLPLAYTKRKIYQHPELGAGTLHETCEAPDTLTLAQRLLDTANFVGLASVEAKRNASTGEVVLMEANVRVPQGFGLGDAAGVDASWRLYATLARLPLPQQPPQRQGVRLIVATRELHALAELIGNPGMLRRRIGSYRNVRAVSGIHLDDPRLVMSFLRHVLLRGLQEGWRFLWSRRRLRPTTFTSAVESRAIPRDCQGLDASLQKQKMAAPS